MHVHGLCSLETTMMDDKQRLCLSTKNMDASIMAETLPMFPGFRFSPTDEELITYYLKKKLEGSDPCVDVIPEIEIWKYEPWDLPAKAVIQSDNEWFFFSPRGRKYPNGSQSRRATETGYWKATGKERNVKSGSNLIGTKRTLVFHTGRAPKGQRTEWLMHEFCMIGRTQDSLVICRLRKNSDFHLNDRPRKSSLNQRHSSAANDCTTSSVIEQTGRSEDIKVDECCSKEGSSSFNSHLVELSDSGYESDDKLPSESSQQDSRHQKGGSNEEDCFADIMKDDIINLDDSSLRVTPELLPMVSRELESLQINVKQPAEAIILQVTPFQGTANRRLRLRKPKVEIHQEKPVGGSRVGNESCHVKKIPSSSLQQSQKGSTSRVPINRIARSFVYICLIIMVMLVLFLYLLGGPQQLKRLSCV